MKTHFLVYTTLITVVSGLLFSSCNFLDKMPDDQKTMDMVWEKQKETESYLYSIYSVLPREHEIWEATPWVGAADEADMIWERYQTASINVGNWSPTNSHYNPMEEYYKAIRCTFVFENNVDRCLELSEALKIQYKAEVKFLRANYYWLLLRQYGPVVLIKEETDINDDWNNYPRTPYDECVEYICNTLDEAAVDLPWNWSSNPVWYGKPDKMACLAVKSEVLLMAASPQWNGNTEYSIFRNKDGAPLVSTSYDENKWKLAAAAAKAVIDAAESNPQLNVKLYRNNENGDSEFNAYKSVRDVHLVRWNCEALWGSMRDESHEFEKHSCPRPGGWSGMGVTQRQVDAFFMLNGKTIQDGTSGYTETGFAAAPHPNWTIDEPRQARIGDSWGHRIGESNMYANREARFYASVLYNGRPLPNVADDDRDYYSSEINKNGWGRVEFYRGGISDDSNSDHTETGYLIHKYVHPESNPYRGTRGAERQHTYIRLAKIYLNYIEALNEYDPNHSDIKKYWDMIRKRAGLPSIFDTYPSIKGNTEKQLEYIIRERQVELCFESDRYFTTRRRWIAHTTDTSQPEDRRMFGDGGAMYGVDITAGGNSLDNEDFYKRRRFETRVFEKKMYLFPIPQSEMDRNNSMVQNPWW